MASRTGEGFNLYLTIHPLRRMNALKHLLTERLRSHKHLPPLHAMELLAFPYSSRCGTSTVTCAGVIYHHCVASTAWFGGSVQDTAIWCHAVREAGQSTGAGLGKESSRGEEAGGSQGQA